MVNGVAEEAVLQHYANVIVLCQIACVVFIALESVLFALHHHFDSYKIF